MSFTNVSFKVLSCIPVSFFTQIFPLEFDPGTTSKHVQDIVLTALKNWQDMALENRPQDACKLYRIDGNATFSGTMANKVVRVNAGEKSKIPGMKKEFLTFYMEAFLPGLVNIQWDNVILSQDIQTNGIPSSLCKAAGTYTFYKKSKTNPQDITPTSGHFTFMVDVNSGLLDHHHSAVKVNGGIVYPPFPKL